MPKKQTSERKLAAIILTDIVGYSSLMGDDETAASQLIKKNRKVQKPIIEKHGSKWLKEIKKLGDPRYNEFLVKMNLPVD